MQQNMPVSEIVSGARHRRDMGDLDALSRSIQKLGLLHPVVVRKGDRTLVAGERRLRACRDILGWERIPARLIDIDSILDGERDENDCRKDLTLSEKVALAEAIKEAAGERRGGQKSNLSKKPSETLEKSAAEQSGQLATLKTGEKTRDCAAESAGFSSTQEYRRAAETVKNGVPELAEAMDGKKISPSAAAKVSRLPKRKQKAVVEKINEGETPSAALAEVAPPEPAPEPEAASPPQAGPVDGWGIPIQPHAAEAFKAQADFDELLSLLRKADRLYSKVAESPGGAYLLRPGISINARDRWKHAGIKTALMNVEDNRPTYTVCPRAYHKVAFPDYRGEPHGDDCNLCHGLNWCRALRKGEVEPEVVARAKEAFGVGGQEDA